MVERSKHFHIYLRAPNHMKKELVYDDISLFSRQISTIKSRFSQDIKLTNNIQFGKKMIDVGILMSAPMLDVSGEELCSFLGSQNHVGVLHRFMSAEDQLKSIKKIIESKAPIISFSIGIHDSKEKLDILKGFLKGTEGLSLLICIDTANGASELLEKPIKAIKDFAAELPEHDVEIMAGNIVTREAAQWLYNQGVRFVRVGIGGGSVCTTPLATGIFRPVVSAIIEIDQWKNDYSINDFYIVADGGIKGASDVMKAIAVGSDFVMLGSLFAGWDISNGPSFFQGDKEMKNYRGMASTEMAELNNQVNSLSKKVIPEGVSSVIPYKGEMAPWFDEFIGSLRSSMSYNNARTIEEFKINIEVVEISGAGNNLRQPHQLNK